MIDLSTYFVPFAIAVAIGLLIGVERESLRLHSQVNLLAGLRTFLLVSIWGFIAAILEKYAFPNFFIICLGLVVVLIAIAQYIRSKKVDAVGLTTATGLILTFLLGGLAVFIDARFVLALGVVIALILSFKSDVKQFLGVIPREAVLATVQFAVLTAVILPFLPNSYIDSWQFLNPYVAWWIVILITGVSFFGYILSLLLGSKNSVLLTATLGGIVSSTATTSNMAQLSKTSYIPEKLLLTGCVVTTMIAFFRILVMATILNREMFFLLLGPIVAFTIISLIFIWRWRASATDASHDMEAFKNPFRLASAMRFALLFICVAFIAKTSVLYFGTRGLYLTSFIVGFADSDAITITITQLFGTATITPAQTVIATTLGLISNMWLKCIIVAFGSVKSLRKHIVQYTLLMTVGALAVALLLGQFYFN